MKQPRGEDGTKGFNIGPVGDVLELNDKAHPFFKPPSAQTCEYCGYSEFQLKRKLKACSKCKKSVYCSTECQQKGWKLHKATCLSYSKAKQGRSKKMSNSAEGHTVEKGECNDNNLKFNETCLGQTNATEAKDTKKENNNLPEWKKKNKKKKKSKSSF